MEEKISFNSRKEWENYIWLKFIDNIRKAGEKQKAEKFLNNLLTEKERKIIAKRLATLALIKEGRSYKEIGKILWISPGTISSLKKSIKKDNGYRSERHYNEKSAETKRERTKGIPPQTILNYWLNIPLPPKVGRGRWRFLYYQG